MSKINRTKEIQGKYKTEVNAMLDKKSEKIPMDNGYFGDYTLVTYRRKQAIVFVDDRNGLVKVVTDWYDKIFYGNANNGERWSGDHRWNSDKPVVVMDKKRYNAVKPHKSDLLLEQWLPVMTTKFVWRKDLDNYCLYAEDESGKRVMVMKNGFINQISDAENVAIVMEEVKKYSEDEVLNKWIRQNKPCAHICGLEYKGAKYGYVSAPEAEELFKTHKRFGGMFNSAEWRILDGRPTLLFRDYCNSDYD